MDKPVNAEPRYRLYKRRFAGVLGFVVLNIVAAMGWPWFGPISNDMASQFGITLNQVNWLGNIIACVYIPTALIIPIFCTRYGIRRCCDVGAICLILASWIRYSATARGLSSSQAYGLLMLGQIFAAVSQPIFQVLGPAYSQIWFDLQGRTTATMVIAIANPIGGGLSQLVSPIFSTPRQAILALGIIATAATPFVFLIGEAPPTPPTYAASQKSPSLLSLCRAMAGVEPSTSGAYMTKRERIDFAIVIANFAVITGATSAFAIQSAQIFAPYGYSDNISGLLGATLLLVGIVAAVITAPLFDRVFTHRLALTSKFFVPCIGGSWIGIIFAVRPHNTGALFALMAVLGACTLTMLPVALELACELTRNADGSSALLWLSGNAMGVTFVLVQSALRASKNARPPLNMHRSLIFNGVCVMAPALFIFLMRGKQARKELDERKLEEQKRLGGVEMGS